MNKTMETKWYYERNDELLNSEVNKTFEQLLWMSDAEFREWVIELRKTVVRLWDEEGIPPRVGFDKEGIIDNFYMMINYPVKNFETADMLTDPGKKYGKKDIIRNTSIAGNAVNQWFPTMMKTKISYSANGEAKSIYDFFANDDLLETFIRYATRHFKRDGFFHYSRPMSYGDTIQLGAATLKVTDEQELLEWFAQNAHGKHEWDYWFCPVKDDKKYTGYDTKLIEKKSRNIYVSLDWIKKNCSYEKAMTNLDPEKNTYNIRIYRYGQKVFPIGLKSFRVSFCQYATQFPPLTARYVYERYTEHIKDQGVINIWDPSSGWAGRLIGAMSVDDKRNIHYIGTDPNTDHDTSPGRTKYHEVADFFNEHIRENGSLFPKSHTYEIFQCGSEEAHKQPGFQRYKGKLDMVFTSPPYFNKEVYSDDPEQSCHKFGNYEDWVEGFLRPTLETAVSYLKPDRYLVWNIADIVLGNKTMPLEEDSCRILRELGMEYVETLKMSLAQMPGGNRLSAVGETVTIHPITGEEIIETNFEGSTKNFCEVRNASDKKMLLKYEPLFVFRKKK
jgi:hypothetical protein